MQPWRSKPDGYALICGQVAGDMSVKGVDLSVWYRAAEERYRTAGFKTRFRPHPNEKRGAGVPLSSDLAGASVAVTWNSNSAVEAVLHGVPTVTMDAGSMAYSVTGHEMGAPPPTPDRTAWARRLAWCQYTREELATGFCWDAITGAASCATAA
jgi:hypothetical protein